MKKGAFLFIEKLLLFVDIYYLSDYFLFKKYVCLNQSAAGSALPALLRRLP